MRLKKRLLAFSRRLHARIRKTRYMHKMRCLLINRTSLLLALRLLWKTPIFPSNSRFPRLCAKCLLKFFLQAEDGIRDPLVTGVQTCALPILQPFSGLTPEVVLDAAAAFGLAPDGRLFALNSYENRVYQLGAGEGQLVLKFYRPRRWTDAQIVEEHQFTAELAAAELAVAAPLAIGGETLLRYHEFRFAAFPWMRGRSPELYAPEARQILGRSVARLHQVGAVQPFAARPRIGIERLGWEARSQVLASELLPDALRERYVTVSGALLERVSEAFTAAAGVREIRLHGDCHLGNLLWNEHGPVFVDLDDCASGVRAQDLWMMLAGSPAE